MTTGETTFSDAIRKDPAKIFYLCARVGVDETSKTAATDALKDCLEHADLLTPAQVRDGLKQVLLSDNPGESLDVLMDSGVMKKILPEIVELDGPRGAQDPIYHAEGNVWVHTKMVVAQMKTHVDELPPQMQFTDLLAALLHDIGKPDTQEFKEPDENGVIRISNLQHDLVGADIAETILERLQCDSATSCQVVELVREHMRMHATKKMKRKNLQKTLARPFIESKIRLQASDADGSKTTSLRESKNLYGFLTEKLRDFRARQAANSQEMDADANVDMVPILTGKILQDPEFGYKPGPKFKDILAAARKAQQDNVFSDEAGAREWLRGLHTD